MTYDIILITDMAGKYWHLKPLGAYRLASELRLHGYSVKVIDYANRWMANPKQFFKLLSALVGDNTLFIGFSSTFFGFNKQGNGVDTKDLRGGLINDAQSHLYPCDTGKFETWLKLFKQTWPKIKIVYGGAKADSHKRYLSPLIDYVVVGLADTMGIDLANHLKYNTPLKYNPLSVNGSKVIDYDAKGASFNFVNSVTKFELTDHIMPGEILPLETSRGCMFKCKFCSYPLLGRTKTDPDYHRNPDCLTNEIKYNWEQYGVTRYNVVDDTFNEMTSKIQSVGESIKAAGVAIEFGAYIRIDLLHRFPEQIQLLKDIGLRSVFFGIESFNDASATAVGKGLSSTKVKETLKLCRDVWGDDVVVHGSFIAGLPYETQDSLQETMTWLLNCGNLLDSFSMIPLSIDDHGTWSSEFYRERAKYGYLLNEDGTWRNDHWDQKEVTKICSEFDATAFEQGITKVASTNFMGLLNLGYEFDYLKGRALRDLPWKELEQKTENKFLEYMKTVFEYERIDAEC